MKPITIRLDDGAEVTAQVEESDFTKLNKATTLSQNGLCANATIFSSRARTGYERVKPKRYYYTSTHDYYGPSDREETGTGLDADLFKRGDYINDEQLFNDRDRARVLYNRLEQWQALNDEPVDWGDNDTCKYTITFNCSTNSFAIFNNYNFRDMGAVYFSTREKAQEAIEVFHDELMWYYTEYRSRLDEPARKEDK